MKFHGEILPGQRSNPNNCPISSLNILFFLFRYYLPEFTPSSCQIVRRFLEKLYAIGYDKVEFLVSQEFVRSNRTPSLSFHKLSLKFSSWFWIDWNALNLLFTEFFLFIIPFWFIFIIKVIKKTSEGVEWCLSDHLGSTSLIKVLFSWVQNSCPALYHIPL